MELHLYLETEIISFIILLIIWVKGRLSSEKRTQDIAFLRVVCLAVACLLFDAACTIFSGIRGKGFRNTAITMYILHYCTIMAVIYEWGMFVRQRAGMPEMTRAAKIAFSIPAGAMIIFTISSAFNRKLFYFDMSNNPVRSWWYLLYAAVMVFYLIWLEKRVIHEYTEASTTSQKSKLMTIAMATFIVLAAAIASVFFDDIPLISPAIALAALAVYIDSKNRQISTDALTGLNNRAQFDKYIAELDDNCKDNTCLVLADVDKFKSINDTYGHLEGDRALRCVSQVLKDVCDRSNTFIARYGGDEFVIVFQWKNPSAIYRFIDNLRVAFEEFNKNSGLPYRIEVSFGYANYERNSQETPTQLVKRADEKMYNAKMTRKAARQAGEF